MYKKKLLHLNLFYNIYFYLFLNFLKFSYIYLVWLLKSLRTSNKSQKCHIGIMCVKVFRWDIRISFPTTLDPHFLYFLRDMLQHVSSIIVSITSLQRLHLFFLSLPRFPHSSSYFFAEAKYLENFFKAAIKISHHHLHLSKNFSHTEVKEPVLKPFQASN